MPYLFALLTSRHPDVPNIHCIRPPGIVEQPPPVQGNTNRRSVSTLRPSAKDAYMLFQVCPLEGGSFLHGIMFSPLQVQVTLMDHSVILETWIFILFFVKRRQEFTIVLTTLIKKRFLIAFISAVK